MSTPRHLLSIAIIASFSLVSLAHADGLKDQWITRQPQSADFVKVSKLKAIKLHKEKVATPKEITKEESIATMLRRKARQETRMRQSLLQPSATVKTTKPEVMPAIFGEEEKIRSIQKQEKLLSACANLHPRERATCLRAHAFKKTVRMQSKTEVK